MDLGYKILRKRRIKTEQEISPAQLIEQYSLFLGLGSLC